MVSEFKVLDSAPMDKAKTTQTYLRKVVNVTKHGSMEVCVHASGDWEDQALDIKSFPIIGDGLRRT